MKQYETENHTSQQSSSLWKKFKPRKRRLKKCEDLAPSAGSSRTNSDCSAYRINTLSFKRRRPNGQVQVETLCNGTIVCDNIAIEGDTSEDDVVVQINDNLDNLMPVQETAEESNRLNTPHSSFDTELTHM